MAKRRMFSTEIVRSDAFLELPVSSRELYFQLGMDTDDRGYVSNARSIIRLIGANQGDLEPLITKGFLMIRGDSLILQKHFKINNLIRSDRMKETEYIADFKKLFIKENGSYTEDSSKGTPVVATLGIPNDNQMTPQDNLIKDNLSKEKIIKDNLLPIEDKDDSSNKKLHTFTQPLVNILIESGYIEKDSMDEISVKNFVIDKMLKDGIDPLELKKRIISFISHYEMVDEEEIDNKSNYLKDWLNDSDNLPF